VPCRFAGWVEVGVAAVKVGAAGGFEARGRVIEMKNVRGKEGDEREDEIYCYC